MKTFIQLRDNVGFAVVHTAEGEPDHSVTPDHTTAIEVVTSDPDQFLKMRYDETTKSWSEAPLIVYGVLDDFGNVVEIRRTYFAHEAEGHILIPMEYENGWRWINGEWVTPTIIDTTRYQISPGVYADEPLIIEAPQETEEERLARVALASKDME